jgi:hypothetical protein
VILVEIAPYADIPMIDALDAQATAGIEGLREYFMQQFADLLRVQGRCWHFAPL